MCGIICGLGKQDITPLLIDGLRRLEYRGYDSAGVAIIDGEGGLRRLRAVGKVESLARQLIDTPMQGRLGIAHTRWATHGGPRTENAHPHISRNRVAVVHNGIIENHETLRQFLREKGYEFQSETDTEVIVHLVEYYLSACGDLLAAVKAALPQLEGAYTFGAISTADPDRLVAARHGSPLVLGMREGQCFLASDSYALLSVADQFIYLEEGDVADVRLDGVRIYDAAGAQVQRPLNQIQFSASSSEKGGYRHYMLKEIFEQPAVLERTLGEWMAAGRITEEPLAARGREILERVRQVRIVACGTSYHAGLVARNWFEELGIPCVAEIASEFRYRHPVVEPGTLLLAISQSGETADTLAALREGQKLGYAGRFAICNVPNSTLAREADQTLLTRAGQEVGVASTKAFTTQLVILRILSLLMARRRGVDPGMEAQLVAELGRTREAVEAILGRANELELLAPRFAATEHALFLGRGTQYPVAMEGALKLKEISYVHAEAYPAGELKHGPLALVDSEIQVVCNLPDDALQAKTLSNLKEVQARGGNLVLFADERAQTLGDGGVKTIRVGRIPNSIAPIAFTIPLQLLAYHTALLRGADVDQPRNLAKSVTVE